MRQAIPNLLWLGHAGDARQFETLQEIGIQALVQLAIEEPAIQTPRDLLSFRIPIIDGPDNPEAVLTLAIQVVAELLSRRIPTLLACGAGLSRSVSIGAAAIAVHTGQTPESTLTSLATAGPHDISPTLWNEISSLVHTRKLDDRAKTIDRPQQKNIF